MKQARHGEHRGRHAFGTQQREPPTLHLDLPVEADQISVRGRGAVECRVIAWRGGVVGQRPLQRHGLLWRQAEHAVQSRLRRHPGTARRIEIGVGPAEAQVGLHHLEPGYGPSLEPRLCRVAGACGDIENRLGQSQLCIGCEQPEELFAHLPSHHPPAGLYVDTGEREFALRELDAPPPLTANLEWHVEREGLVRRVARDLGPHRRVRSLSGDADARLADREASRARVDRGVVRVGKGASRVEAQG